METVDYNKQAEQFLTETGTTFKAELVGHDKYFPDDKESRDIYQITLERKGKKPFVFRFGQSIANSATDMKGGHKESISFIRSGRSFPLKSEDFSQKRKAPSAYSALACLTKYEVGTFENFCDDFGYDKDSRKAERIYFDVQKEYQNVLRLFGDEMEKLQEIQ